MIIEIKKRIGAYEKMITSLEHNQEITLADSSKIAEYKARINELLWVLEII